MEGIWDRVVAVEAMLLGYGKVENLLGHGRGNSLLQIPFQLDRSGLQ